MDRGERWRQLMEQPEDKIALDEAALIIAAGANPDLDVTAQLIRLDDLATEIGTADTDDICQFLFETLGIRGDDQTFDDPRNSYLDQVLDRRLGIPISLSVLLIVVGRRCGIALEGVGMPGYFLVRDPAHPDLLINPFSGGARLDSAACAELFHAVAGTPSFEPRLLAPVGTRSILNQLLTNLDRGFRRRSNREGIRWVTRLRAAIPGQSLANWLSFADGLAELGLYGEALALLEEIAQRPETNDRSASALRARAKGLSARFN